MRCGTASPVSEHRPDEYIEGLAATIAEQGATRLPAVRMAAIIDAAQRGLIDPLEARALFDEID